MKSNIDLKATIEKNGVTCDIETEISVTKILKELENNGIKIPKNDEKAIQEIINIFILGFQYGCNVTQEITNFIKDITEEDNENDDIEDDNNIIPFN